MRNVDDWSILRRFGWLGYAWLVRRQTRGEVKEAVPLHPYEELRKEAAELERYYGWSRLAKLRALLTLIPVAPAALLTFSGQMPPEIGAAFITTVATATHIFFPHDDAFLKLWLAKRVLRGYGEEGERKLAEGRENELRAVELLRLWASEGKLPGALRDSRVREGISRALPYLTPEEKRRIGADNLGEFMIKYRIPVLTKEDLKEAKKIRKFLER